MSKLFDNDFTGTDIIDTSMYDLHIITVHSNQCIYIMCNNKYHIISDLFDTPTKTMNNYIYSDDVNYPNGHIYIYSINDNNTVYLKFNTIDSLTNLKRSINKIYYLDENENPIISNIKVFTNNDKFNYNVNNFKIIDNNIYFIDEKTLTESGETVYNYYFYKYEINSNYTWFGYTIENYSLIVQYNSIIPLLYSNQAALLIDSNGQYKLVGIKTQEIIITKDYTRFFNNLDISKSECLLNSPLYIDNSLKCNDVIIDGSRFELSNYNFDCTNTNLLYYGYSDSGLYIITKDTDENPVDPSTFRSDYHLYYIGFDSENNITLPKTEISLNDLPITINNYKIITAYIYNNLCFVLINDLSQPDVSKKYLCPVYNTIYRIHTYTKLGFEWIGYPNLSTYRTPYFNKFIYSYVINESDVYVVDVDRTYIIFFKNKEPDTLYELLWYTDNPDYDPTHDPSVNIVITEKMHTIHNITSYIYLMCDGCYYRYDITNITMTRIEYVCIEYPGPLEPPDILPTLPTHLYNYQFSVCDFIIAYGQLYTIFFKFNNLKTIYYLDERNMANPVIRPLIHPPSFKNTQICAFTIKNGYIYYMTEYNPEDLNHHSFISYNSQNRKIVNEKQMDNYILINNYYSIIPIIYSNNGAIMIETNGNYKCCKATFPLAEISGLNTYIKNFRIVSSNNSIILAAQSVITPNNLVTTKLITQEQIIKSGNAITLTQYSKGDISTTKHHYQTTKGLFYVISESNPGSIRCYLFTTHKTLNKNNFLNTSGTEKEYVQAAFEYNDMLYVLIGTYITETHGNKTHNVPTTNLKMLVFDVINNVIEIVNTIQIINDDTHPFNGENMNNLPYMNNINTNNPYYLSAYYLYDPCIVVKETNNGETNDELYIFNSYTNKLYKVNLLNTVLYFEYVMDITYADNKLKLQQYVSSSWNDITDKIFCYIKNIHQLFRYDNNDWTYNESVYVDNIGEVINPSENDYQFIGSGTSADPYKLQQYINGNWVDITNKIYCYIYNSNKLFTYYNTWTESTSLVYVNDIGTVSPSTNAYQFIRTESILIYALQQYNGSQWNTITNKVYCYINNEIQLFKYVNNTWEISDSVVYVNGIGEVSNPLINDYQFIDDSGTYKLQQCTGYTTSDIPLPIWTNVTNKECCYIMSNNQLFTYNGSWSENLTVINVNKIGKILNPSSGNYQFIEETNTYKKLQEFNINNTQSISSKVIPQNNTSYSNVEKIMYNNNYLYFVYYKRIIGESGTFNGRIIPISSDYDPNSDYGGSNNCIHFKRKYNIFVFDMTKLPEPNNYNDINRYYQGYNIYIQYNNTIPKLTGTGEYGKEHYGNSDVLLYNFSTFNDNNLYFNFLNQNRDLRGIFYLNIFTEALYENPKIFTLSSQLYPTNAFIYNMVEEKFFIVTTQDFKQTTGTGPQLFSYYLNYVNTEDNTIQSVKFAEKTDYSKFSMSVEPILLESTEILLIDNNRKYDIFQASLCSHMFTNNRTVLNNNVIITPTEALLFNNLTITNTSCKLSVDPKNNNDIVHKKYVDNLFNGIATNELILRHTDISLSALVDILTNGSFYTNDVLIGKIFKYYNQLEINYLYYGFFDYGTYFIGDVVTENNKKVQNIYMLNNKSLDVVKIDTLSVSSGVTSSAISSFVLSYYMYILLPKSIVLYEYGTKKNTYTNISGYNNLMQNYKKFIKSIMIIENGIMNDYLFDNTSIYKLEINILTLAPSKMSILNSGVSIESPIYDLHHITKEENNEIINYVYIICNTGYYKYNTSTNILSSKQNYTYQAGLNNHTYKYSIVDNNIVYFKFNNNNNKIYYLDELDNNTIKEYSNVLFDNNNICNYNIINNVIYYIKEAYDSIDDVYDYTFYSYDIINDHISYEYELNDNSFKLSNTYNSNIPLLKSNSSVIFIDDNSVIANRYPLTFVKIQNITFTSDYSKIFNNLYITKDTCKLVSEPIEDDDVVTKKYVDSCNSKYKISYVFDNIKNSSTSPAPTDETIFYDDNGDYILMKKIDGSTSIYPNNYQQFNPPIGTFAFIKDIEGARELYILSDIISGEQSWISVGTIIHSFNVLVNNKKNNANNNRNGNVDNIYINNIKYNVINDMDKNDDKNKIDLLNDKINKLELLVNKLSNELIETKKELNDLKNNQ